MVEVSKDVSIARSLWTNGNFLLVIFVRTVMVAGRQMLSVAVGWDVYARTGSAVDLGLIGLAMFFPVLLFAIPAGLVADRIDRRIILSAALTVQFACALAIGACFAFGGRDLLLVYVVLLASGSAHAFINPALNSIMPKIVTRDLLSNGIAAQSSTAKIAQLVSPVAAGFLIAAGGQVGYLVTAALFALAAISALLIRANLKIAVLAPFTMSMLTEGIRFIWATPKVFAAMSLDVIAVLFGGVVGILPIYAADILAVGSEGLGLMRAAPAVGGLAVGVFLATFRFPWPIGRAFFLSLAVFSASILVFGLSTNLWISLVALTVYGASDMVSVYIRQTLIQIDTPDELRGRVTSVNTISAGGSTQLGDFRAGVMAGMVGTPAAVAIGGLITLAATIAWSRRFPELRKSINF